MNNFDVIQELKSTYGGEIFTTPSGFKILSLQPLTQNKLEALDDFNSSVPPDERICFIKNSRNLN